ncbi:hypothetical protein [Neorhizobium sp. DAR64860/K0K1]|uniref:hypothetical protein n=1 Tax=Neorhizobium sp. DAR64860/K0K1 TaxID=3421955 RepID=UPI003D273B24
MAERASLIWADGPSSMPYEPNKALIRAWGTMLEQQTSLVNSPLTYSATGDGTTNDATNYARAEAANDNIFLPSDALFNLGSAFPTKPVYGPGKLKKGSVVLDGYQMQVDAYRSTIFLTPSDYTDKVGFPSSGYNKGVLIGSGAKLQGTMNRFVGIGSAVFQEAIAIDRSIAIGDGNMQYTRYAERMTSVGTATSQWLGASLAKVQETHPWWIGQTPTPGQAGWDFNGMETRNPGIGAKIAAFTAYATAQTDAGRSVAIGRDAIGGNVISLRDVAVGYRALAGFSTRDNTAIGNDCFWDGVFITESTGLGQAAGGNWQEGTRNLALGRNAAQSVVRGSYSVHIGPFAASLITDSTDNLFLGYGAGNALTGASQTDVFVLSNRNRNYMMVGNFATGQMGLGVDLTPALLKGSANGSLHIQNSSFGAVEAASTALDDLILESGGTSTGMTIRSAAGALGQIGFARPGQASRGVIGYNHATDQFDVSVAGTARLQAGAGVIIGAGGSFMGVGTLNVIADIYRGGIKVLGARETGYAAMTGTGNKATVYDVASVTLPQLAARVASLQASITTHGMIGA